MSDEHTPDLSRFLKWAEELGPAPHTVLACGGLDVSLTHGETTETNVSELSLADFMKLRDTNTPVLYTPERGEAFTTYIVGGVQLSTGPLILLKNVISTVHPSQIKLLNTDYTSLEEDLSMSTDIEKNEAESLSDDQITIMELESELQEAKQLLEVAYKMKDEIKYAFKTQIDAHYLDARKSAEELATERVRVEQLKKLLAQREDDLSVMRESFEDLRRQVDEQPEYDDSDDTGEGFVPVLAIERAKAAERWARAEFKARKALVKWARTLGGGK
jgi:hypothetical protein